MSSVDHYQDLCVRLQKALSVLQSKTGLNVPNPDDYRSEKFPDWKPELIHPLVLAQDTRIFELEGTISVLLREAVEAKDLIEHLSRANSEQSTKIADLEHKVSANGLQELRTKDKFVNSTVQEELSQANRMNRLLKEQLSESEMDKSSLQEKFIEQKTLVVATQEALRKLHTSYLQAQDEIESLRKRDNERQSELDAVTVKLSTTQRSMHEVQEELKQMELAYKNKTFTSSPEYISLQSELASYIKRNEELFSLNSSLSSTLTTTKSELVEVKHEFEILSGDSEQLLSTISSLESQLRAYEEREQSVAVREARLDVTIDANSRALALARDQVNELQKELESVRSFHSNQLSEMSEEHKKSLDEQREASKKASESLLSEISALRSQVAISTVRQEFPGEQLSSVSIVSVEAEHLRAHLSSSESTVRSLRARITELEGELRISKLSSAEHISEDKRNKLDIEALSRSHAAEREALQTKLEASQEVLENSRKLNEKLRAQIRELETTVLSLKLDIDGVSARSRDRISGLVTQNEELRLKLKSLSSGESTLKTSSELYLLDSKSSSESMASAETILQREAAYIAEIGTLKRKEEELRSLLLLLRSDYSAAIAAAESAESLLQSERNAVADLNHQLARANERLRDSQLSESYQRQAATELRNRLMLSEAAAGRERARADALVDVKHNQLLQSTLLVPPQPSLPVLANVPFSLSATAPPASHPNSTGSLFGATGSGLPSMLQSSNSSGLISSLFSRQTVQPSFASPTKDSGRRSRRRGASPSRRNGFSSPLNHSQSMQQNNANNTSTASSPFSPFSPLSPLQDVEFAEKPKSAVAAVDARLSHTQAAQIPLVPKTPVSAREPSAVTSSVRMKASEILQELSSEYGLSVPLSSSHSAPSGVTSASTTPGVLASEESPLVDSSSSFLKHAHSPSNGPITNPNEPNVRHTEPSTVSITDPSEASQSPAHANTNFMNQIRTFDNSSISLPSSPNIISTMPESLVGIAGVNASSNTVATSQLELSESSSSQIPGPSPSIASNANTGSDITNESVLTHTLSEELRRYRESFQAHKVVSSLPVDSVEPLGDEPTRLIYLDFDTSEATLNGNMLHPAGPVDETRVLDTTVPVRALVPEVVSQKAHTAAAELALFGSLADSTGSSNNSTLAPVVAPSSKQGHSALSSPRILSDITVDLTTTVIEGDSTHMPVLTIPPPVLEEQEHPKQANITPTVITDADLSGSTESDEDSCPSPDPTRFMYSTHIGKGGNSGHRGFSSPETDISESIEIDSANLPSLIHTSQKGIEIDRFSSQKPRLQGFDLPNPYATSLTSAVTPLDKLSTPDMLPPARMSLKPNFELPSSRPSAPSSGSFSASSNSSGTAAGRTRPASAGKSRNPSNREDIDESDLLVDDAFVVEKSHSTSHNQDGESDLDDGDEDGVPGNGIVYGDMLRREYSQRMNLSSRGRSSNSEVAGFSTSEVESSSSSAIGDNSVLTGHGGAYDYDFEIESVASPRNKSAMNVSGLKKNSTAVLINSSDILSPLSDRFQPHDYSNEADSSNAPADEAYLESSAESHVSVGAILRNKDAYKSSSNSASNGNQGYSSGFASPTSYMEDSADNYPAIESESENTRLEVDRSNYYGNPISKNGAASRIHSYDDDFDTEEEEIDDDDFF